MLHKMCTFSLSYSFKSALKFKYPTRNCLLGHTNCLKVAYRRWAQYFCTLH
ncbi:unnamed protein product [Acanthoscelides obtectus]|uniref:Uncharacterized protein n=1 Tax=Acanthoscelides obtectus TaxID=200917 RepID=A0A9P0LSB6_ACAOB|nr:unnamed protein product [Acanthoscelides obtectus]CAK1635828.1 hypothetical protein AOBTE_LOCUS9543 [Acanthoscelides obtectus]